MTTTTSASNRSDAPTSAHRGRRHRRRAALFALLAALALITAACGDDSDDSTDAGGNATSTTASSSGGAYGSSDKSSTTETTAAADGASNASVAAATTSLGDVVVDAEGFTLYLYEPDTGPTSTCFDACAAAWPPATVTGTPTAGTGVTGDLTTTTRPDGSTQIVFAGQPLYRYTGDNAPGDVNGQDVGGIWYAMTPAGETIED